MPAMPLLVIALRRLESPENGLELPDKPESAPTGRPVGTQADTLLRLGVLPARAC